MPFATPLPLSAGRVTIRLVEQRDVPDLLSVNGDDEVTRFLPYPSWQSLDDGYAWYQRILALNADGDGLQFVIEENAGRRVIGSCLLFQYDEASARAEIGYVLARAYWGRGLAQEAVSLLVRHAFDAQDLRRLEAQVNPLNTASNRLLTTIGFTQEGRLRQRFMVKGQSYDVNIYGLLRDEWQAAATSRMAAAGAAGA